MYTIQNALTTGPTAMNHIPAPRPSLPCAGNFHFTNYGVARNIWVTRDGYKRFFEIPDDDLELEGWWLYIFSKLSSTVTAIGEVLIDPMWPTQYMITIIDYSHGALMDHAIRNQVQNPQN